MIKTFYTNIGENAYLGGALDTIDQLVNKFCSEVKVSDTQINISDRLYIVTIIYDNPSFD